MPARFAHHRGRTTDANENKGEIREYIGGGGALEREANQPVPNLSLTFRESILAACGADPSSGLTGRGGQMIGRSEEMAELTARMTARSISQAEALQIITEAMTAKSAGRDPGPPSSLRFFLPALDRFAAARDTPILDLPQAQPFNPSPKGRQNDRVSERRAFDGASNRLADDLASDGPSMKLITNWNALRA